MEHLGHYRFSFDVADETERPSKQEAEVINSPFPKRSDEVFLCLKDGMKGFFKKVNCPSSQELADLENGSLAGKRLREVQDHLDTCDFCDAEAELYARYPVWPGEMQTVTVADIPPSLYELADSILRPKEGTDSELDALLTEYQGIH